MERKTYKSREEAIKKLKEEYPITFRIPFSKNFVGFKCSYSQLSTDIPNILEFWKVGKGLEFSLGIAYKS